MKILLSEGSGLTARQCATRLAAAGHTVHVLTSDPWCLCRFTRTVSGWHRVPPFGSDPPSWLERALDVYRSGGFDLLFPTQEQVAVLAWAKDALDAAGVRTVVPTFSALAALQDKVSACATLERLGIPQPLTATETDGWDHFPAFVKESIGTASGGVRRVTTSEQLNRTSARGRVVIQEAAQGPLVMCQSVFDHGQLVAFHANLRIAEGARGGASHKLSLSLPEARHWLEVLGRELAWHGALSADVILTDCGPTFIDMNPRLVEPQNASLAGVDLVGALLDLAITGHATTRPDGRAGVATHQLLLAVLGAAEHAGRRGVWRELRHAAAHRGNYAASREELTPCQGDPRTVVPLVLAAAATLVAPRTWSWFASGGVSAYALTAEGWQKLLETNHSRRIPSKPNPLETGPAVPGHGPAGGPPAPSARTLEPGASPGGAAGGRSEPRRRRPTLPEEPSTCE